MVKIGTPFQNCFQLLIGIESMNDGEKHKTCLDSPKSEEERNTSRHGERSKKGHNEDHGMKKMKVLLKGFVREFSTKSRSYSQFAMERAMVSTRRS